MVHPALCGVPAQQLPSATTVPPQSHGAVTAPSSHAGAATHVSLCGVPAQQLPSATTVPPQSHAAVTAPSSQSGVVGGAAPGVEQADRRRSSVVQERIEAGIGLKCVSWAG